MHKSLLFVLFFYCTTVIAQPANYTTANLHSHNDYEKPIPFWEAYRQGYGSIEADIFLYRGKLIVAHDTLQRTWGRTLDSLYLQPLQTCLLRNKGYPYASADSVLQLLIDLKTDSVATLDALVKKLDSYPSLTACPAIKIVITGNRPAVTAFTRYPPYILFDGELSKVYPPAALDKIVMLSDNFRQYSLWNGLDTLPAKDRQTLSALIGRAHQLHKKVRFWNAPDYSSSWKVFMELGVDYINTDHITGAAAFIRQSQKP